MVTAARAVHDSEPDRLSRRALDALKEVDGMPPALRECVHEFGYAIVRAMIQNGVTKPNNIRQLVQECWIGPRHPSQGNHKGAGRSSPVLGQLDWLLIQAEAKITAKTLLRLLWMNNMVIVSRDPSSVMVDASMATVRTHTEVMTKPEKHKRRLVAAIEASARRLWPHLFDGAA